jgi:acetyl-CoA carboxylase beta subunit
MQIRRKKCPVCHVAMHRFLNPERWVCPKENTHAGILAKQRQREAASRGGKAGTRTGKQREQARQMGKIYGGKSKKLRRKRKTMDPGTGFVKRILASKKARNQPRDARGRFKKKGNGK